ncbi:MAG: trigger factor [Acidobacteriaceae bacterium]
MKTEKKDLKNGRMEFKVSITKEESIPWMEKAAREISKTKNIKGFRPGKAPYDLVKREVGEEAIFSEALDGMINDTINSIIETENLNTYGKVDIDILPASDPSQAVSYKLAVNVVPTVKLGDWQTKKIKRQKVEVTEEDLKKALDELATMAIEEAPAGRPAAKDDKAVVDFDVFVDGKPIEGGSAKDFSLVLGEGRMIPGFEDKIIGAKDGDKLEFNLNFPDNYQAEHLKGKPANFKIEVKQIFSRTKPEIGDELAKRVGMQDIQALKDRLSENIKKEKQEREEERVEIAAMKQIVESSEFGPVPELMISDSAHDLTHEFEHSIAEQGINVEEYLKSMKKDHTSLQKEFAPKAAERVKSSLALGQVAEDEKIKITPDEVEEEIEALRRSYQAQPHAIEQLNEPETRRQIANTLVSRKIIKFIKDKVVE